MIDVRLIRTDLAGVRSALARRHDDGVLRAVDRVADLDVQLRRIIGEREQLRAQVNSLSNDVGRLRRDGKIAEAEVVQAQSRSIGETEQALGDRFDVI
ncbi:MAG: serine--tRNA ligase, partial [Ilumatobacteraceae bacterium]